MIMEKRDIYAVYLKKVGQTNNQSNTTHRIDQNLCRLQIGNGNMSIKAHTFVNPMNLAILIFDRIII